MPMIPPKELRQKIAKQNTPWLVACLHSNRTCPARREKPSTAIVNAIIRRELQKRGEEQNPQEWKKYHP